ncbi:MAG: DinB family protein [Anaerolineaceae bacterium]|nr:DinB family protein [Anaerolineaceae bacterium]
MSEAEHLSEALITLLVRSDNGWFTPFTTVVEGLLAEQALLVPAPGMNCIWAVVNHMRFWNEVILLRLRGLPVNRKALGAENGWPRPGSQSDERAWQMACSRTVTMNAEVARLVGGLSDEDLTAPLTPGRTSRYRLVHGLIAHNAYHTSEITAIRQFLGILPV